MKRIISLIAATVLLCALIPVATAEDEVYLRLVGGSGRVGDTVTVDVIAENAPDCIGMNMVFQYDDAILQFVSGRSGDLVESGLFFCEETTYGGQPAVRCMIPSSSLCFTGTGTVATVSFRVLRETEGKYGTPLKICYKEMAPMEGKPFAAKAKHGRVYVGADEVLSTAQVVEIMRHRIGIPTPNEGELDWNGDGQLTIADAVMLLRELN